jgi:hypothetical protein
VHLFFHPVFKPIQKDEQFCVNDFISIITETGDVDNDEGRECAFVQTAYVGRAESVHLNELLDGETLGLEYIGLNTKSIVYGIQRHENNRIYRARLQFDELIQIFDSVFALKAVIYWNGSSVNSGHYWTIARVKNDWFKFNDTSVIKVDSCNDPDGLVTTLIFDMA